MIHISPNKYAPLLLFLSLALWLAACNQDEYSDSAEAAKENITIKLRATSRATGNDTWMRDDDDQFSSLAIYVFDQAGGFLALHKVSPQESVNVLEEVFTCSPKARSLYVVANYTAYTELDAALTPMPKNRVKALVANQAGGTSLGSQNILMAGEVDIAPFAENEQDETRSVAVELHRLAARVDVFVFKEAGWENEVMVTKVEFSGGIKNSTLDTETTLPSTPASEATLSEDFTDGKTLVEHSGEAEKLWNTDDYLCGRFYTYRTPATQPATVSISVLINGTIAHTYSTDLTSYLTPEKGVALQAGRVYQVRAVLTRIGLIIEIAIADWDKADDYPLTFDYPQYTQMSPLDGAGATPYAQPTVYYVNEGSTEGAYTFNFRITGPQGQVWTPTLDGNPAYFDVEVLQGGTVVTPEDGKYPISEQDYQIRVKALKPYEGTEMETALGISCPPAWAPQENLLLLIGGTTGNLNWEGSDMPELIKIKQIERPTN